MRVRNFSYVVEGVLAVSARPQVAHRGGADRRPQVAHRGGADRRPQVAHRGGADRRPQTQDGRADVEDDLAELVREGFAGVVSLTEAPLPADAIERSGLEHLHLPVHDFSAPSLETVGRFVDFVRRVSAERGSVLVHCGSGYGRSGTMAACYLVAEGRSPEEAVEEMRRLRPGSIETDEQEAAVRAWAAKWNGEAG